jgi:hypothetical protein
MSPSSPPRPESASPKICFITAIYGGYEITCKPFVAQSIPADFVCFTDNRTIEPNGWIIDTTQYHLLYPSPLDDGGYRNSLRNNSHTFNIAKYYKQAFRNIPALAKYEVVVWIDGTIKITNGRTAEWVVRAIYDRKIIGWEHEERRGDLLEEVRASHIERYMSPTWNGQRQPVQDVDEQWSDYLDEGYDTSYFKTAVASRAPQEPLRENLGVWITCFVAFLKDSEEAKTVLDAWYLQTLKYSTQDQIGFPYALYINRIVPYTLPDAEIGGAQPHYATDFYVKCAHGE